MGIKLLLSAPHPSDATSFYRAVDPLNDLRKHVDLDILSYGENSWVNISMSDLVFFQRPYLPQQVELAHFAKKMKKPIISDFDDDLTCVPLDNPTHDAYSSQQALENMAQIVCMSDVVTTSTEALANKIRKIALSRSASTKVVVIPNALNMDYFKRISNDVPTRKTIMWRGSGTHLRDMMEYSDEILEIYKEFQKDWVFYFMGWRPYWIWEKMSEQKRLYHGWVSGAIDLCNNLQAVRSAIHIVPLHDSEFNHAKSRISDLESTLAGSVCLGPNWEEWQGGHNARYSNPQDFYNKLKELIKTDQSDLLHRNSLHWKWIEENRTLENVNQLRKSVIENLLGSSRYFK